MIDIDILKKNGFHLDEQSNVWIKNDKHTFDYNDGDETENFILNSVQSAKDRGVNSSELKSFIKDWASLYHLSNRRSNLIRPFESLLNGKNVLEIGCGCGAITRYLGEIGSNVVAVEGSARRALIARERCKELANVEIVCAINKEFPQMENFDIVLLIGVLEYSPKFLGADGPNLMLQYCKSQMKKDGYLIIAIENQLGLKYFAGLNEDHAGKPMYGINNSYKPEEFRTWGRKELLGILNNNGFPFAEQYIPLPDYKLPVSIISPYGWKNYSDDLKSLAIESSRLDYQRNPFELFSLEEGNYLIWKNNLSEELANSFLFLCSKDRMKESSFEKDVLAYYYTDGRRAGLNKYIKFIKNEKNEIIIQNEFTEGQTELKIKHNILKKEKFYKGKSLWFELVEIVNKPGWELDSIKVWVQNWLHEILLKEGKNLEQSNPEMKINGKWLDAMPFNAIKTENGEISFFDLEWESSEEITLGYFYYRGLFHSLLRITTISDPSKIDLLNIYYIIVTIAEILWGEINDSSIEEWIKLDGAFQSYVSEMNAYHIDELKQLRLAKRFGIESLFHEVNRLGIENFHLFEDRAKVDADRNRIEIEKNNLLADREIINAERYKLAEEIAKLKAEINLLNIEKNAFLNSISWKVTKPLRLVKKYINRIK